MPTRYQVETVLYNRWSGSLAFIWDRTIADPTTGQPVESPGNRDILPDVAGNPLYNDPIAYGLSVVGRSPADPTLVVDGDLSSIAAKWVPFTDLAEYRLLQNLLGSNVDVTSSDFGRSASYSDLRDAWQKRASELMGQYKSFLTFYAPLIPGTIRLPITARSGQEF